MTRKAKPKPARKPGKAPAGPRATQPPAAARFFVTTVEVEGREETRVVERPEFEPEPWGIDAALHVVGRRLPRVDGPDKAAGRAKYTADIQRPGMLHAVIVRSRVPAGRVVSIDAAAARAIPDVLDVITGADVPGEILAGGVPLMGAAIAYAGQPVAAVCATTAAAARRAAHAVRVAIDPAPFVVAAREATAANAPRVRAGGNVSAGSPHVASRGDVARGLREAAVVITREYRTPVALHSALEPHGAVAEWEGPSRLTVWESTQGIFRTRAMLAAAFTLPLTHVRVIKEHMGGGFGAKNGAGAHTYVAALLARRLGAPVRCVNDREAEQTDAGNRPATRQRVTLGAAADGRLTAIALEALVPLGIGGWEGGPAGIFHELYRCANVHTTETFAWVNTPAMSAFRAPGHVEGAFALERAMHTLARALGMDPLELRLRNLADRDQVKDRPYSGNRLRECYRDGARRFGWPAAAGTSTARASRPLSVGPIRRGVGMAAQIWSTGGGPPAYAIVRLNRDGTADVLTGTQDLGTGARTVLAQVAAEALGSSPGDVHVVLGDTERTPYTGNSWGSMTTPSVAPAVRMAAEDARRQLLDAAAPMLGARPDELTTRGSVVRVRGGRRSMPFARVADRLGDIMILGRGSRGPNPEGIAIATFGAQFAEVEVDTGTGVVRVLRVVAVHDAGRILNPLLAESQLQGGILQGLGYALFEERVLDGRLGVPLNPTLHDYKIPTMADVPRIDATCLTGADPVANHVGARGLAEPPIIPTAPAIANAVADALGVEVDEIPLTPWRVLAALRPHAVDRVPAAD